MHRDFYMPTKNLPFSVSLRWRSTALCVARLSAVFARREGFLLPWATAAALAKALVCKEVWSPEVERARVWTRSEGETGVWGALGLSAEEGELPDEGDDGMGSDNVISNISANQWNSWVRWMVWRISRGCGQRKSGEVMPKSRNQVEARGEIIFVVMAEINGKTGRARDCSAELEICR